jgi:AraC family transcriptional regulator of adaptative response/methylated-DNA-[protein]-cysteine methyltransferase
MHALEESYHYRVIARALQIIDAAPAPGPSLADLAANLGMSPAHFQKLFSAWVGVSPKRYQQYLALDLARHLVLAREPLAAVADHAGLSGTGRLHDLFVRWEAMSPGTFAQGGAGQIIRYGWFDSAFGDLLAMGTDLGLCGIAFSEEIGRQVAWEDMAKRWPSAEFRADSAAVQPWVIAAMQQKGETALHMIGAPFQIKVWEALLSIPSGQVTTYTEIAGAIGRPRAVRAVGTAVGRNPLAFLIPCHRALRKSGALGGYHWGLPVKRAMLAWEAARKEAL